jgi:phosphoribosylanthranilate isomerase
MALPIRLEFMDQGGKVSQWYEDEQTATYDYELFIAGGLNVSNILNAM